MFADDGHVIVYSVEEVLPSDSEDDYIIVVNGYNIINIETTEATVVKVWEDNGNNDGKRPETISVQLLADGKEYGDPVTLSESNKWTATIENLPKYADGVEIVYTWTEDEDGLPEGYSLKSIDKVGTVTTLTNSHEPEVTDINVNKVWRDDDNRDGLRPESIEVQLFADGVAIDDPVVLSEENDWSYEWHDLDVYSDGVEIEYTVEELNVPYGYTIAVNGNAKEGFTIINPHEPELTEATVIKVWDDQEDMDKIRPLTLTVNLMNGETVVSTVVLSAENNWTATVEDLYKYENGKEIEYTWVEVDLPNGYNLTSTTKDGTVTTLTNTHIVPPPTGDMSLYTICMMIASIIGLAIVFKKKRYAAK
jgi:hypothetical protein